MPLEVESKPFATPPHPIINYQSPILVNFKDLFLLSPSEIKQELCKFMTSISQEIDRYKVPVLGKNGKLNETIEVSALWSSRLYFSYKSYLVLLKYMIYVRHI